MKSIYLSMAAILGLGTFLALSNTANLKASDDQEITMAAGQVLNTNFNASAANRKAWELWKNGGRLSGGIFAGHSLSKEDITTSASGFGWGAKAMLPLKWGFSLEGYLGKLKSGYHETLLGPGQVYYDNYGYPIYSQRILDEGGTQYWAPITVMWQIPPLMRLLREVSIKVGGGFSVNNTKSGIKVYDKIPGYSSQVLFDEQKTKWGVAPAVALSIGRQIANIDFNDTNLKLAVEASVLHLFNKPWSRDYFLLSLILQKGDD